MIKFTAHYLLVRDEFCLIESVDSLRGQGVENFQFCVPRMYWDGTHVDLNDFRNIRKTMDYLASRGCHTSILRPMFDQRATGVEKETHCRNVALQELDRLSNSHNHVLVVDSDEIWRPGTVRAIEDFWFENQQKATTVRSLNIIGLPGYPVKSVADGLLVHVWTKHTKFAHARSIDQLALDLPIEGVIHFTSTRKTKALTIDKHRKSTHYDDSAYDFEGWIKDVFPNIKPGMKNAHMYKHWQVWPKVRSFTKQEWVEMPDGLKQYLGAPK